MRFSLENTQKSFLTALEVIQDTSMHTSYAGRKKLASESGIMLLFP